MSHDTSQATDAANALRLPAQAREKDHTDESDIALARVGWDGPSARGAGAGACIRGGTQYHRAGARYARLLAYLVSARLCRGILGHGRGRATPVEPLLCADRSAKPPHEWRPCAQHAARRSQNRGAD